MDLGRENIWYFLLENNGTGNIRGQRENKIQIRFERCRGTLLETFRDQLQGPLVVLAQLILLKMHVRTQ